MANECAAVGMKISVCLDSIANALSILCCALKSKTADWLGNLAVN